MAGEQHLYLVVGGDYENAADSPEAWQFGVRLALVFGAIDPIGTFPANWTVTPDSRQHTNGNWDTTTQFAVEGVGDFTFDPQSYMEDYVQPSAEALWSTGTISNQVKLTTLKLSPIGSNGKVVQRRTVESVANTDIHGTTGGAIMPPQNSIAVSTRTNVIGPRGRGRFFLPPTASAVLTTYGRLTTAFQTDVVTNCVAFIEGLKFDGLLSGDAHVKAVVTGSPWVNYGAITELRCGDVVDTQRRRRGQLVESYLVGAVS